MKLIWEDKYKNLICRSVLMSKIILVIGGVRLGKSNFVEKLCFDRNNNIVYIVIFILFDDEMKDRVKKY